jgi:hypothetical protein
MSRKFNMKAFQDRQNPFGRLFAPTQQSHSHAGATLESLLVNLSIKFGYD